MVLLGELASLGASRYQLLRVTKAFMKINKNVHVRHDFANMQVSQIIAAVYEGRALSATEYMQAAPNLAVEVDRRERNTQPLSSLEHFCAWALPQAAKLSLGYPDLYPHHAGNQVDPRVSWYDGSEATLPTSSFQWRVVSS
jgi:hypothetical protein